MSARQRFDVGDRQAAGLAAAQHRGRRVGSRGRLAGRPVGPQRRVEAQREDRRIGGAQRDVGERDRACVVERPLDEDGAAAVQEIDRGEQQRRLRRRGLRLQ